MLHRKIYVSGMVVIFLLGIQGLCGAGKITTPRNDWSQVDFQGKINHVSREGDFIVASERKIILVDMRHQGNRYKTNLLDSQGRRIKFEDFKKGRWVYVVGGLLPDKTVGARNIYLLPGQLDEKKKFKKYPALANPQPWGE